MSKAVFCQFQPAVMAYSILSIFFPLSIVYYRISEQSSKEKLGIDEIAWKVL